MRASLVILLPMRLSTALWLSLAVIGSAMRAEEPSRPKPTAGETTSTPPAPASGAAAAQSKTRVVTLAMRDGLRFEPPRFSAKPGEEIILEIENVDATQQTHNFLLVKPGRRDAVVQEALALGDQGPAQSFVPKNPDVILHTALLEVDKIATLKFRVPTEAGIYPYVCTFPGHALVMFGALYAGVPEPPLAQDPNIPPTTMLAMIAGAGRRPFVQRMFMPGAGPAAIAVALPDEQNVCWDAGQCRLRYAWKGAFIEASAHWRGKGGDLATLPGSPWWSAPKNDFPLRFGAPDRAVAPVQFLGYRLDGGVPEFRYRVGEQEVFEKITSAESGSGITLHFRVPNARELVFWRGAAETKAEARSSAGEWVTGSLRVTPEQASDFTVTLKPRPAAP